MDRCALFVDAEYALGNGAFAVHGTRNRDSVSWDYAGLLKLLGSLSRDRTGLPLLRCYWYDIAPVDSRVAEHNALADMPAVKVRLSGPRPGRSEGVEAEIRKDLITLSRNRAVSDVIIVSAAEDLAPVVAEVQEYGLRAVLLHYGADESAGLRGLREEFDEVIEVSASHLRPFVELIPGAEPRYGGAGYRELPAGAVVSAPPAAIEAPAPRVLASAIPAGYERTDQLPAMSSQGQNQRDLLPAADTGRYPLAQPEGQAQDGPGTQGATGQQPPYHYADAAGPGFPAAAEPGFGQASFPQPGGAQAANGHAGAGLAPDYSQRGMTADAGTPGSEPTVGASDVAGMNHGHSSAGLSSAQPGNGLPPGSGLPPGPVPAGPVRGYPADDRAAKGIPAAGRGGAADNGLPSHEAAGARLSAPRMPGYDSQGNGQQTVSGPMPGGAPAPASTPGGLNEAAMDFGGHGQSGPHQTVSGQPRRPAGLGAPGQHLPPQQPAGQPGQLDGLAPLEPQQPPPSQRHLPAANGAPYGEDRGAPYSGRPQQSTQPSGQQLSSQQLSSQQHPSQQLPSQQHPSQQLPSQQLPSQQHPSQQLPSQQHPSQQIASQQIASQQLPSQQAYGSGSYGAPPPSMGDAVKSAHVEGFGFGEAVARDAPALWLEAVLARKPRMPSDLEARLLQGSTLPIDSLLHDEVRHALRRGFWDALERSRH